MLPGESNLEIRTCLPARANGNRANGNRVGEKPPLLFVHGGYCDAWCWAPYFLPWFAARGHAAHALSLRGHGTSAGRETLFVAGLDDFAADVLAVAAGLPSPPVLIGHSMGAAVIERLLVTHPARGAALISPVPPTGVLPMAARLAAEQPDYLMQLLQFDPARLTAHVLDVLRPYYFSPDVAPEILTEATKHLCAESPRALLDLSLRLHWQLPQRNDVPLFVLGAEGDRVSRADDVRATARHHGVEATIVPGLAHMLMLERQWERAARELARWLASI
jgi:pimeloyl-ACP methyl ester carboxylesterase